MERCTLMTERQDRLLPLVRSKGACYFASLRVSGRNLMLINSLSDVTMGSYDAAKICELVCLFLLNHIGKK
jgi:hypothetical protein